MTIEQLKKIIADAGCVGAGGAGFPSAVKLAEGADSLVINAAECEPLLYSDYALMKQHLEDVAAGAGFPESLTASLEGKEGYELRFFLLEVLGRLENVLHRE
jgi:Na+-translocating ferredoxin:NAD+ oxidoreductase RnfC subunit